MADCIYLRKSRVDVEAESYGAGDTLARHEQALLRHAASLNRSIAHIYREVVSGETISARPQMQLLLRDVEAGAWDAVHVMEVERLARGDTLDQGIVSQAFLYSGTLIITPKKTYDPKNEFDENIKPSTADSKPDAWQASVKANGSLTNHPTAILVLS